MSGFSFGTSASQSAADSLTFGGPKSTAAAQPLPEFGPTTSGFGTPPRAALTPTSAAVAALSACSFGAPAASSAAGLPTFGLQGTTTQPTFGLGGTTSYTLPTFGLGAGSTQSVASIAPIVPTLGEALFGAGQGLGGAAATIAFSCAKPAAPTAASLNFATTSSAQPDTDLFATTAAPATSWPFLSLGGVHISTIQPKIDDPKQQIMIKETQVPEEIAKRVDALITQMQIQKTMLSDIGSTSTTKLANVSDDIKNLQGALQDIVKSVEATYKKIKLLRQENNKIIPSVEMVQSTQNTPSGLQLENIGPFQYFQNLVAKYEKDFISFRQQFEITERHMHSLTNPQTISPEDLKRAFQQIHESFTSLAGQLYEIHQKIEAQKQQYLNLRKHRLGDSTNVFEKLDQPEPKTDGHRISPGPSPFSMSCLGRTFTTNCIQPNK